MGYENSQFGYAGGATTADSYGVHNHYGPREVSKSQGVMKTEGAMNELVIDLDGEMLNAAGFALLAPVIPAGSRIEDVFVEVTEVFALSADSGNVTIEIGTETSEATNGVSITEAQAEALGTYDATSGLAGTWAGSVGLAADTTLGIALSGDVPVATNAGKARVVIRYIKV